jgi:protein O-GlcNAc transferase
MVDRAASHRHNRKAKLWNKMSLDVFEAPAIAADPRAFGQFWSPLRDRTLRHHGIKLEGTAGPRAGVPVLGYVDRQKTGRRLTPEVHDGLVQLLEKLHAEGTIVFEHLQFEDFTPQQQLSQVAPVDVSRRGLTSADCRFCSEYTAMD